MKMLVYIIRGSILGTFLLSNVANADIVTLSTESDSGNWVNYTSYPTGLSLACPEESNQPGPFYPPGSVQGYTGINSGMIALEDGETKQFNVIQSSYCAQQPLTALILLIGNQNLPGCWVNIAIDFNTKKIMYNNSDCNINPSVTINQQQILIKLYKPT